MPATTRLFTLLVTGGLLGGLGTATAAEEPVGTLARISGAAIVNQGSQYVTGREGMPLVEGDRLLVLEGGSAVVVFADGCERAVADNELLVVPAISSCAASDAVASDAHKVAPYNAVAETTGPDAAAKFQLTQMGAPAAGAANLGWIPVVGAAAVVGVAVADDDDDGGDGGRRNHYDERPPLSR
ncbi:hypothetical protein [Thiococcus pfennigii]|uniref:hypothetical protein n=1 Tax=Thiococcus pfennigii TaxID=1057 RepID=UPI00190585A6|nr:hypothetical protein [Thiococcus pfennigii]MBK1701337.1 hypothetical protein [Thiococcus pfennigii]